MAFPLRFTKSETSENNFDPGQATRERQTALALSRIRKETALLEQHARNDARRFHRWLKETMPTEPKVAEMEQAHPELLESEEPHDAKRCPACHES